MKLVSKRVKLKNVKRFNFIRIQSPGRCYSLVGGNNVQTKSQNYGVTIKTWSAAGLQCMTWGMSKDGLKDD